MTSPTITFAERAAQSGHKTCSGCGETKPHSGFYRRVSSPDGYRARCRSCMRDSVKRRYWKDPDASRAYERKFNALECRRKARKRAYAKWAADPRRSKANYMVQQAVAEGRLIRPEACSSCSRACRPDGHHPDYDKPLDVVWLCRPCHKIEHQGIKS